MSSKLILNYSSILTATLCFGLSFVLFRKGLAKSFASLIGLLAVRGIMSVITVALLFHRKQLGIPLHLSYDIYFYSYWTSVALQIVLQLMVIYSVYRVAMKPLEGLQQIGKIVFRWATAVSLVLSLVVAFGPHSGSALYFPTLMAQAQSGESVLTVCLLVFVCLAARPLGVTYRSRPFGVLLGLGFSATSGLVLSAWFTTTETQSLYAPVFAWGAALSVMTMAIWGAYFVMPEPQRKMILLPTTSPYFHWNSISEALGDDPGVVAVSGFSPDMLAPAELAAFTSASRPSAREALEHSVPVEAFAAAR